MRSLATSRRLLIGLAVGVVLAATASVRVAHAPPRALLADTAARAEVVTPLRLALVVVTQPAVDSAVIATHAQLPTHKDQHRSPFQLLGAFAAIGATSSGGGKKSGGSKRASKRGSKRSGATDESSAGSEQIVGGGTIPQSEEDAAFNRATSAGVAPAAQTSTASAAGRSGTKKAQKFDETVPGGRYKGTDGRFRSADGALHPDQSSD